MFPSISMTTSGRGGFVHRLQAAGAALVFTLAIAGRGLCPMSPAESVSPDAHACCQTGIQAATPSCCLAAPAAGTPARETPAAAALGPTPAAFVPANRPLRSPSIPSVAELAPPTPSPPAAILRI